MEDTLDELIVLIKKLTAANTTNILVTADHGFVYQNRPIEESDFSACEARGQVVHYHDRRFALGKRLEEQAAPAFEKICKVRISANQLSQQKPIL